LRNKATRISAHTQLPSDQQESIDNAQAECLKSHAGCNQIDARAPAVTNPDDLA